MAPLVVIIFNFVVKNAAAGGSTAGALVIGLVSLVLYVGGLVFAIYALSQVRNAGRQGVLAPAIVGLILNGLQRHPRFLRITTYSPRNHVHEFRLTSPSDVDDTFRAWVAQAYRVGSQAKT